MCAEEVMGTGGPLVARMRDLVLHLWSLLGVTQMSDNSIKTEFRPEVDKLEDRLAPAASYQQSYCYQPSYNNCYQPTYKPSYQPSYNNCYQQSYKPSYSYQPSYNNCYQQ